MAGGLTSQPFGPKLRHIKEMFGSPNKLRWCALLLGLVFLGAQFHFCSDLTAGSGGSHFCQLCSAAGSVITAEAVELSIVPLVHGLEVGPAAILPSKGVARATTPRAPPVL